MYTGKKLAHGKKHSTKYSNFNSSEALKLQDVSDTDDQDEDADMCTMCQKEYPPSGKSKNITWIECSQCHHWYHL